MNLILFGQVRLLAGFIIFTVFGTQVCFAIQKNNASQSGLKLREPISIEINIDNDDSAYFVNAKQENVDYRLKLEDSEGRILKESNIRAFRGMDEILYFDSNDCRQCKVTLEPAEDIDKGNAYELYVTPLSEFYPEYSIEDKKLFSTLLMQALKHQRIARESGGDERKSHLTLESKALLEALNNSPFDKSDELNLYVMMLLADCYSYLGYAYEDKHIELLEEIERLTSYENQIYQAYAVYELGGYDGDLTKGIVNYSRGVEISKELNSSRMQAAGINYIGMNFVRLGKPEEGINLFLKSLENHEQHKREREVLKLLNNLSWANRRLNKPASAMKYAVEQMELAKTYNRKANLGWAHYNRGTAYSMLGELDLAVNHLGKALQIISELPNQERTALKAVEGYSYQALVDVYLKNGYFELAEDTAVLMKQSFSNQVAPGLVAEADRLLADISMKTGRHDVADKFLQSALEYDVKNNRQFAVGETNLLKAKLELRKRNLKLSSNFIQKSLIDLVESENYQTLNHALVFSVELLTSMGGHLQASELGQSIEARIFRNGDQYLTTAYLKLKAQNQYALGEKGAVSQTLKNAFNSMELLLSQTKRADLRKRNLGLQKDLFELAIKHERNRGEKSPLASLQLVRSFKGRTLVERIRRLHSGVVPGLELKNKRLEIESQLQNLSQRWSATDDSENYRSKSRRLAAELAKLEAEHYRNKDYELPEISIEPEVIYSKKGELIINYFLGKDHSWVWVTSENQTRVYDLPGEDEINAIAKEVRSGISTSPYKRASGGSFKFRKSIEALSKKLIDPIVEEISKNNVKQLKIIRDGSLHSIPFAMLLNSKTGRPLITSHALSYSESETVNSLLNLQFKPPAKTFNALVIANSSFEAIDGLNLAPLEYVKDEVYEIKQAVEELKIYLNEKLNQSVFVQEASEQYSVLHFATHALVNQQQPELSGLVFPIQSEVDESHLWLAPQISRSVINTNLVVLSACESALGPEVAGEGYQSLSRAFVEAGARQVIATLWKIEDRASAELIGEFYRQYAKGQHSAAEALRSAQLYIYNNSDNDWRDPYYWSGFQLTGG